MFRVADLRKRTAIAPRIVAHLYTWGPGHTTAEGEDIPVQVREGIPRCGFVGKDSLALLRMDPRY